MTREVKACVNSLIFNVSFAACMAILAVFAFFVAEWWLATACLASFFIGAYDAREDYKRITEEDHAG